MKKNYFLLFGILFIVFLGLLVHPRTINLCQQKYLHEENSPDGNYKAVLFTEDCGATTTISTKIAILLKGVSNKYWRKHNIVLAADDWIEVQMTWSEPKSLTIKSPPKDSIFLQKTKFRDIQINYN